MKKLSLLALAGRLALTAVVLPWPLFHDESSAGNVNSGHSGIQIQLEKNYANAGYYESNPCGYSGARRPLCHIPLGLKVAFGAPFWPIGCWIGWRGLHAADWRNPRLSHALWCALRLLAGGTVCTLGLLIMIL